MSDYLVSPRYYWWERYARSRILSPPSYYFSIFLVLSVVSLGLLRSKLTHPSFHTPGKKIKCWCMFLLASRIKSKTSHFSGLFHSRTHRCTLHTKALKFWLVTRASSGQLITGGTLKKTHKKNSTASFYLVTLPVSISSWIFSVGCDSDFGLEPHNFWQTDLINNVSFFLMMKYNINVPKWSPLWLTPFIAQPRSFCHSLQVAAWWAREWKEDKWICF